MLVVLIHSINHTHHKLFVGRTSHKSSRATDQKRQSRQGLTVFPAWEKYCQNKKAPSINNCLSFVGLFNNLDRPDRAAVFPLIRSLMRTVVTFQTLKSHSSVLLRSEKEQVLMPSSVSNRHGYQKKKNVIIKSTQDASAAQGAKTSEGC